LRLLFLDYEQCIGMIFLLRVFVNTILIYVDGYLQLPLKMYKHLAYKDIVSIDFGLMIGDIIT